MKGNLSRAEVRKLSRALKSQGLKLPRAGWCTRLNAPVGDVHGRLRPEVCRDRHGYYYVGDKGYA